MAATESNWSGPPIAIGAILTLATAVCWIAYSLWPASQPPAMAPEKFMEAFKEADKVDRQNWEKMWRSAGEEPPSEN